MIPESGGKPGRKPRVTDEEILQLFRDADPPVLTASALAEELPIGHRGVLNRLNTLWDRGTLDRMDVGPRGRVWWLPGHTSTAAATVSGSTVETESGIGPDSHDVDERREPPGEPNLDAEDRIADPAVDGTPDGEQDAETASESESTPPDVETALDEFDLDDDRREAVRAMYEYLRDAGTARKSDFTGEVYPEHPAGFGSAGGWWNALGKDALGELPNARKPPEGRPMWQFGE